MIVKNIFERIGYQVSDTRLSPSDEEINLLFIINTDGSIRWIWPAHLKTALFLKFYSVQGFKSMLLNFLFRLTFVLRLQAILFNHKKLFVSKAPDSESDFDIHSEWSLFTGTIGPNNKAIMYVKENGLGSFIKIALSKTACALVEREMNMLNQLKAMNLQNLVVPDLHSSGTDYIRQSDLSIGGKRSAILTDSHFNALIELNELTGFKMQLNDQPYWIQLKKDLLDLNQSTDKRLPKGMIRKLIRLVEETNQFQRIEVSVSHGDFTPWNMYENNGVLHVYDWELADHVRPLGYDLFHFVIQQGILVNRKSWKEIRSTINSSINEAMFNHLSKFKKAQVGDYLKMYMIFNTVYYLKLYAGQATWHKQVHWLLNTWNEGLSELLFETVSARELVIADTFDFLLDKKYAAIKYQSAFPEKIDQYSDLDLCIDKKFNKALFQYLETHPLTKKINLVSKSFMATQQVFFKDGSLLSIDLIWKIKRKGLELMSTKQFLESAQTNVFGVKMPNAIVNARYIGLFYSMNNCSVPPKYRPYEELLCKSEEKLDRFLHPCFIDLDFNKQYLLNFIKQQKENKGCDGFINQLLYFVDSAKDLVSGTGSVITFSGVDGAGKSTVIENLKHRIEKQLRKRVVVLRHRPSILPILSVFSKGKNQAQLEASSGLPRKGTNTGFWSSLIRFAYYYTDYLVGQFIVYIKYVSRGYIVIYDRYYFDFIHDSKRSNIVLPKRILKAGFRLLLKPRFNFFLYADAETILSRKKELDEITIQKLTADYLEQFSQLNQIRSAKYTSIQNTDLKQTLDRVFNIISNQAA